MKVRTALPGGQPDWTTAGPGPLPAPSPVTPPAPSHAATDYNLCLDTYRNAARRSKLAFDRAEKKNGDLKVSRTSQNRMAVSGAHGTSGAILPCQVDICTRTSPEHHCARHYDVKCTAAMVSPPETYAQNVKHLFAQAQQLLIDFSRRPRCSNTGALQAHGACNVQCHVV